MHHFVRRTLSMCLAAGLILTAAGCATSQSQSDGSKTSDETSEEESKGKDAIPELKPLEFRSEAPEAEKTGEKYGVKAYEIGELTLLHKPTPANQVVSAKVYIDGGVANLNDETAGIERLALRVSANGGTESTEKDEFTSKLDSMGSSVETFTSRDYSGYTLRTITKHFDGSWKLFVEAMLEPAMPKSELGVQRRKQIASIKKIRQNPNRYVTYISRKMVAENHPYRHMHLGTKSNVKNFKRDELLAFQRSLLNPARLVVVVVGDVSTDTVVEKVRASLGRLKSSSWTSPDVGDLTMGDVRVKGREKDIPTNYIFGAFPAPDSGSEDYAAMEVAMTYLSDRLFEEVRTKRNLSYAVSAGLSSRRANRGYLYVSAKKPNETLGVMFDSVERLKNEKLDNKQLKRTRNVYITEHYQDLETNSSQATNLARAELVRGDWRTSRKLLKEVKSVTPADVQRVVQKYMTNYQFALVGDPESLDKSTIPASDE